MMNWGEAWSGGSQLWWTGARPGQSLSLALPVERAGPTTLVAAFTKAPDYGTEHDLHVQEALLRGCGVS